MKQLAFLVDDLLGGGSQVSVDVAVPGYLPKLSRDWDYLIQHATRLIFVHPPSLPHRELHVSPVPVALPRLEGLGVRHRVLEVLAGGHGGRARVPVRVDHGGEAIDGRLTDGIDGGDG